MLHLNSLLVSARPLPFLSPSHDTYLSQCFSPCICFSVHYTRKCLVLSLEVTKPFVNSFDECKSACAEWISYFEIQRLCSIFCWLKSETPLKVCIKWISWSMHPVAVSNCGTYQRKLFGSLPQPQEFDNWKWGYASEISLPNLSF